MICASYEKHLEGLHVAVIGGEEEGKLKCNSWQDQDHGWMENGQIHRKVSPEIESGSEQCLNAALAQCGTAVSKWPLLYPVRPNY